MASPMGSGFGAYVLTHVETGQPFYTTHATEQEILSANQNLRNAGERLRYFPEGSYAQASLHGHSG